MCSSCQKHAQLKAGSSTQTYSPSKTPRKFIGNNSSKNAGSFRTPKVKMSFGRRGK